MICKLCLKEKKLLKKSHIIPEFMYQEMFDENHQIYKVPINDTSKARKQFTGEYEKDILCSDCDSKIIGTFEDYASKVLYGGRVSKDDKLELTNYRNEHGVVHTLIENIKYREFKLFLLSILWRASISSREFFKNVNLGEHEELLRTKIYEGDPMNSQDYPCVIATLRNDVEYSKGLHIQPIQKSENSGIVVPFVISGTIYVFYIPQYSGPTELDEFYIDTLNKMKVLHTPKGMGEELIKHISGIRKN